MENIEYFIIFLPLLASIISVFFGKFIGHRTSEILTSLFVSLSAILSIFIFYNVLIHGYENNLIVAKWISSEDLIIKSNNSGKYNNKFLTIEVFVFLTIVHL